MGWTDETSETSKPYVRQPGTEAAAERLQASSTGKMLQTKHPRSRSHGECGVAAKHYQKHTISVSRHSADNLTFANHI